MERLLRRFAPRNDGKKRLAMTGRKELSMTGRKGLAMTGKERKLH